MPQQAKQRQALTRDLHQAVALHRQGRLAEAERLYRAALAREPRQVETLHFLGLLLLQQGAAEEALAFLRRAAELRPGAPEVLPGLAAALAALGRLDEALSVYERLLAASPSDADARCNHSVMLSRLGRHAEALEGYDQVLATRPAHVAAWFNRGNVLAMLQRFGEALASYDRALALSPGQIDALKNRADALKALERYEEAIASYDRVLAIVPAHADALNNRGNALFALQRYEEAIASLRSALALRPDDPDVLFNLGRALQEVGRHDTALAAFDTVIAARPDNADARYSRGNSLVKLERIADAIADYEHAFASGHPHAFDTLLRVKLDCCDWPAVADLTEQIPRRLADAKSHIPPLKLLCLPVNPAIQLQCARSWVDRQIGRRQATARNLRAHDHDRLRIAYLSADFRLHAVAMLIAELFELHDRSRFEVLAISFGPEDSSYLRSRIVKSVDRFHDVGAQSDLGVARLINDLEVDIAVELMGHTRYARIGILAHRPAPIQASFLGYPGTTGADFIDYIIADPVVLPFADQPFYSERIVQLPDCYQVNDRKRAIAPRTPSRRDLGLPEEAFVFCCFNHAAKITAEVFNLWMRLLVRTPGSVLWLLGGNDLALANLRREASERGVAPERLIFAPFARPEDHLARHAAADLFLDTLPYNAHTTASDTLWAGLPLLTCPGTTFAGRVAASLLRAVGLPELITRNLEEYEALAFKLAAEPPRLQSIRRRLVENRDTCALFDSHRFRRHIEAAYEIMWDIHRRGEAPRSFKVEPL